MPVDISNENAATGGTATPDVNAPEFTSQAYRSGNSAAMTSAGFQPRDEQTGPVSCTHSRSSTVTPTPELLENRPSNPTATGRRPSLSEPNSCNAFEYIYYNWPTGPDYRLDSPDQLDQRTSEGEEEQVTSRHSFESGVTIVPENPRNIWSGSVRSLGETIELRSLTPTGETDELESLTPAGETVELRSRWSESTLSVAEAPRWRRFAQLTGVNETTVTARGEYWRCVTDLLRCCVR